MATFIKSFKRLKVHHLSYRDVHRFPQPQPGAASQFFAGTFMDRGFGAAPGCGCGKAVDIAGMKGDVTFNLFE